MHRHHVFTKPNAMYSANIACQSRLHAVHYIPQVILVRRNIGILVYTEYYTTLYYTLLSYTLLGHTLSWSSLLWIRSTATMAMAQPRTDTPALRAPQRSALPNTTYANHTVHAMCTIDAHHVNVNCIRCTCEYIDISQLT